MKIKENENHQPGQASFNNNEAKEAPPTKLFYGWVVVIATFVVLFICFGIAYTFAAFFQSLQREFKASRADVSLVFSLGAFLYFSLGAITGPLADRFGPRWVVAVGLLVISLGLVLASQSQALWQVYATYGLSMGVGVGLAYVPAISTVQRWFVRRRGLASGIATAGIGAGTLIMPLVASGLISLTDWRGAYLGMALLAAVFGITSALLIQHSPQKRGLLPDGDKPMEISVVISAETRSGNKPVKHVQGQSATLKQALSSRTFWLLYGSSVLISFGLFIPFVHLAAYSRDQGWSDAIGVLLVGLIGVGSTAGRFILGGWADRLGRRRSLIITFIGMALMLLWWMLVAQIWALVIFALGFGLCYGGFVALIPALTVDYFGGRKASSIIGFLYTSVSLGALLGPTLAGVAYDLSQSYTLPIAISVVGNLLAVGAIATTPRLTT